MIIGVVEGYINLHALAHAHGVIMHVIMFVLGVDDGQGTRS